MRYSRETSASVTEIMRRSREHFGSSGLGLRQSSLGLLAATFSGPLGSVDIVVRPLRPGANEVEAASQAYDGEVTRFLRTLPRVSALAQLRRRIRSKISPNVQP